MKRYLAGANLMGAALGGIAKIGRRVIAEMCLIISSRSGQVPSVVLIEGSRWRVSSSSDPQVYRGNLDRKPYCLTGECSRKLRCCFIRFAPDRCSSAGLRMRRISMAARDELGGAIAGRYAQGDRGERGRILDEFAAVTGFHRKHAMRLLRAGQVTRRCGPRPGRRVYDEAVREALIVVWEASDRICSKRLRPLLPILVEAMERHGHLQLVPEVRVRLMTMSAATIDRALRDIRQQAGTAKRRRSAPSAAIRRSVPVRTFDGWDDPPPGFVEADLVAHSGPVARGSFVQTLVLTDIAT